MIVQIAIATNTTPDYWLNADPGLVATAIAELEDQAEEVKKKRGRK